LGKRFALLFVVLLVGTLITGCLGGGGGTGPSISTFTVTGSIEEKGTENPIAGAEVTLGSQTKLTNAEGLFEFTQVKAGTYALEVEAEGYDPLPLPLSVDVDGDRDVTVRLDTDAPVVHIAALENVTEGQVLADAKVTLSGNIHDILSERSDVSSLSTAITFSQLQAIVNGRIYEIQVEDDGSFEQEVPLDPGSNTIQLRVFDDHGHAGTSAILRVTVTLPRIDLRVILSWDTEGTDVDLHMFQRTAAEGNVVADYDYWGSHDLPRHVWYWNKLPEDFGNGPTENPALDIDDRDGFGPETILLQKAASGHYHIWVHYYDAYSYGFGEVDSKATVRIVVNGGTNDPKIYERVHTLTEGWEVWYVGTIVMPSGQLIQVPPAQNN
jgi:uncharacterized protein YfaP (DUF2135 family)